MNTNHVDDGTQVNFETYTLVEQFEEYILWKNFLLGILELGNKINNKNNRYDI